MPVPVRKILSVFIPLHALVVRLSIKPISFLLVSNGNANIASIAFQLKAERFFKTPNFP